MDESPKICLAPFAIFAGVEDEIVPKLVNVERWHEWSFGAEFAGDVFQVIQRHPPQEIQTILRGIFVNDLRYAVRYVSKRVALKSSNFGYKALIYLHIGS